MRSFFFVKHRVEYDPPSTSHVTDARRHRARVAAPVFSGTRWPGT